MIWFGALDERELFHPDEGRYAAIPHEMLASGDWITPRLNGLKYFEKPALQYWITAAGFWALGEQEWTARLWPALSGLFTLLLVYYTGWRIAGARAGFAAAALLASTLQFFMFSQVLTLDMGLTFFMTLALLLGCRLQNEEMRLSSRYLIGIGASGIVMALAAPFIPQIPKFSRDADLIAPYVPWAIAGGYALAATALLAWFAMRKKYGFGLPAIAFCSLVSFQILVTGTESVESQFSSEDLIDAALLKIGDFDPATPFYSVAMYDQTLPHHVNRTLTLVHYRGELAMGITQEPERFVASIGEFRARWQTHQQAYAIITPNRFAEEQTAGTPMHILSSNRRAVIVAREEPSEATRRPARPDQ